MAKCNPSLDWNKLQRWDGYHGCQWKMKEKMGENSRCNRNRWNKVHGTKLGNGESDIKKWSRELKKEATWEEGAGGREEAQGEAAALVAGTTAEGSGVGVGKVGGKEGRGRGREGGREGTKSGCFYWLIFPVFSLYYIMWIHFLCCLLPSSILCWHLVLNPVILVYLFLSLFNSLSKWICVSLRKKLKERALREFFISSTQTFHKPNRVCFHM